MSDPVKRLSSWKAKYNVERVKQTLDDLRPDMLARYEAVLADLVTMETKTKEVLSVSGVHTILFVPYLNFARQLFKLSRRQHIAGESLELAAQVLLEKWHSRGLDEKVLAAVRKGVFAIEAP
jgi:hypothetical protein